MNTVGSSGEVLERSANGRTLADLRPGEKGYVGGIESSISLKRRLSAMGVVSGVEVSLEHTAPMGDPRVYTSLGYNLSLRNEDARKVMLKAED